MKDFANNNNKKKNPIKNNRVFTSKRAAPRTISNNTIIFLLIISSGLASLSFLYFNSDVISIKPKDSKNSVIINFPTSLIDNSVLIELKYALEAKNMLKDEIEKISINEIYSTIQSDKLLNSLISGPYKNKSLANNAKEKITKIGFDPRLRTLCKKK